METIMRRLQIQSWLQASNNTGILNTCTRLWLTESEQATPVDSIKDVVRSSMKVPKFEKHLKKAEGYIDRNVVKITIKMKTIVWKSLMIKIIKLRLRNLENWVKSYNYYFIVTFFILNFLMINQWHLVRTTYPTKLSFFCKLDLKSLHSLI